MKTKTIFILIAIAAVAYYFFFNKKEESQQSKKEEDENLNEDTPSGGPVIPAQPIVYNPQPMPANREPVSNMRVGTNSYVSVLNPIQR
jgi:flagellar basal body-associated protein FliL